MLAKRSATELVRGSTGSRLMSKAQLAPYPLDKYLEIKEVISS